MSDKLIQETERVTIEKRFADSMSKCKSPEACKAHEQQLKQALKLQDMIQTLPYHALVQAGRRTTGAEKSLNLVRRYFII